MNKLGWYNPNVKKAFWYFTKTASLTVGLVFIFLALVYFGVQLLNKYSFKKIEDAFLAGITIDQNFLSGQGDAVANNPDLIKNLNENNRDMVLEIISTERQSRNIGLMGVADSEGVIVGRTKTNGKYGDNVFLTQPMGRLVSQGEKGESIELTGFYGQIFMTTGRPIMQDTTMVGGLFANYLLNDEYAKNFTKKFLPPDTQVAFYSYEYGLYGKSFEDEKIHKRLNSYFHIGSKWIQDGKTGEIITLEDGKSYYVMNIPLPGIEGSAGGALVFVLKKDLSGNIHWLFTILTLIIFITLVIHHRMKVRGKKSGWRYYLIFLVSSTLVFGSVYFFTKIPYQYRLPLSEIPYHLYNSTLRLEPDFGIYSMGVDQKISVVVDTGDESINFVEVLINFDPSIIDVKDLQLSDSFCYFVLESLIDEEDGTIKILCGTPNTTLKRESIEIATFTITPKSIGSAKITFDNDQTKVLASDGLGTDVLRFTTNGNYRFDFFDTASFDASKYPVGSIKRNFVMFSPTHPNENHWYNEPVIEFVWQGPPDAQYSYSLSTSSDDVPFIENSIEGEKVGIRAPKDGTYYFHLRLAPEGQPVHYKIQIDRTPPLITSMDVSESNIRAGDVVRFSFDAVDNESGLQRNNYVDIGNDLFLPVGKELFIPFFDPGNKTVTFRVYDNAGNYSEKSLVIQVSDK